MTKTAKEVARDALYSGKSRHFGAGLGMGDATDFAELIVDALEAAGWLRPCPSDARFLYAGTDAEKRLADAMLEYDKEHNASLGRPTLDASGEDGTRRRNAIYDALAAVRAERAPRKRWVAVGVTVCDRGHDRYMLDNDEQARMVASTLNGLEP
jgi:hypothetical protein